MSLWHYQKLDDEQDSIVFWDDWIKNHSNFLLTSNKSKWSNIWEPTEPTCINNNKNYIIGASCSFVSALLSWLESEIAKFAFKQNENLNSNDYVILSTPVILILIFISVYLLKIDLTNINREGMKWITVRSIASILGISALYSAIKYLPTSKVLFIKNLHPLLVTAWGYWLLNEWINKFDIVSLVGAFIGTVVMNITKTNSQTSDSTSYETFIGIILSIIATFYFQFVPKIFLFIYLYIKI